MAIYRKNLKKKKLWTTKTLQGCYNFLSIKNEKLFKKALLGSYLNKIDTFVDVGSSKIYISASRGQRSKDNEDISEILSKIALKFIDKYGGGSFYIS